MHLLLEPTTGYFITDKVSGASAGSSGFEASVGSTNGASRQVAIRFTPWYALTGKADVTLADDSWKQKSGLYRSVITITVTEGS